MQIIFEIPGEPRGKGRPRFSNRGGYVRTYTDEKTAVYENLVKLAYQQAAKGRRFGDDEAVSVEVRAYYGIPKSASKKKQELMLDRYLLPTKKPDADNVLKAVLDGLNGVAFADDKQVTNLSIEKYYSEKPHLWVRIMEARYWVRLVEI